MATTMNSSEDVMASGQIGRIQDFLAAGLRKANLSRKAVQDVIETHGGPLTDELVAVVRKHVEAVSRVVWREVEVDRSQDPQQVIDATGRVKFTSSASVESMPSGEGKKKRVGFFKLDCWVSEDQLAKEYKLRGLNPDPRAQAKVNQDDPAFADSYPNGCHWQDAEGRWHYLAFNRWRGERSVHCRRSESDWNGHWFFGGVPSK